MIVDDIINDDGGGGALHKKERFLTKYPKFASKYPMLLDMCCSEDCDRARVQSMLSLLEDVETSRMTQHDASACVGQELFDRYIKPVIDRK